MYPSRYSNEALSTHSTLYTWFFNTLFKQKADKIQFNIDDNVGDPKYEIIKWKKANCNVLSRWNLDRLVVMINEASVKNKNRYLFQSKKNRNDNAELKKRLI